MAEEPVYVISFSRVYFFVRFSLLRVCFAKEIRIRSQFPL